MKIGIVTQPLHANYGGVLQNYALQQVLKRMGHEVWTIDYWKYDWLNWADMAWRVLAHKMLGHQVKFGRTPAEQRKLEMPLRRFVDRNISLTAPRTKKFSKQIVRKYALDALVVGSDQVWRPRYNYDVSDCFLKFAQGLSVKRVAYAASFGTDAWEFTDAQTSECAALAKQFDGISVREKSGVGLCQDLLGVSAVHVLDPTLLLQAEDYSALCKDIPQRKPFVFAYILDKSEDKINSIQRFAEQRGLPYYIKSADAGVSMEDSIELWLSYFRDAAFVITDSFHGTAFSINFNKDFYVFGNAQRGNSRFDSLLGQLGLQGRIIKGKIPTETDNSIDWNKINQLKVSALTESIEWLTTKLRE